MAHLNLIPEIQPQYMEQDRCLVPTTAKVMDASAGGGWVGVYLSVCVCVLGPGVRGYKILCNIRMELTELPMSHSFL